MHKTKDKAKQQATACKIYADKYSGKDKNGRGRNEDNMETLTRTDKSVAIEILKQLGGNRFIAMTGAKNFACDNNSMCFKLSGTMTKNRINHIKITLNCMDTYDIEFISIWGNKIKTIEKINGIYNDGLQDVISDRTGLALSL